MNMLTALIAASLTLASASTDLIGEKKVSLQGGEALVSTKRIEGKLGRPYTVELRVKCGAANADWTKLPVVDSEAVCDVKPQSAKLSADGKNISILIRETDAEAFNEATKKTAGEASGALVPQCQKSAREFLFNIEKYCR